MPEHPGSPLAAYLENARGFAARGDVDIYPEAAARQDAETYENDVLDRLSNQLAKWATSRAVLDAIAAAPHPVLIKPVQGIQTQAGPRAVRAAENAGAGLRGTDAATVSYSPDAEDDTDGRPAGMRCDETLLHELVHALGYATGQSFTATMGDDFDDEDEFKAILITNIYSSGIGESSRKDHHGMWSSRYAEDLQHRIDRRAGRPDELPSGYHNYLSTRIR